MNLRRFWICAALSMACSSPADIPPDAPEPCPSDPPADGAPCSGSFSCVWERCPSAGVTHASCVAGAYEVVEGACDAHDCGGVSTCGAEQICVVRQGGALLVDCAENPCGDGPITGACACAACSGAPCTLSGRGVVCDTCTSGICP